jgi:2'-5' RNA ligase
MRLFVALDIAEDVRTRIQDFVHDFSPSAPEIRWMHPQSLHVTLKFIGEKSNESLESIKRALSFVASPPLTLNFRGYGFSPGPKRPSIFWIGIDGGESLISLAASVEQALIPAGVTAENHRFRPHITLARSGSNRKRHNRANHHRAGHYRADHCFRQLQEKLAAAPPPEFGTMSARDFFLYESRLSAEGSDYTKIERFVFGESMAAN